MNFLVTLFPRCSLGVMSINAFMGKIRTKAARGLGFYTQESDTTKLSIMPEKLAAIFDIQRAAVCAGQRVARSYP